MKTEDFENSNYVKAVAKVQRLKEFYQNLSVVLFSHTIFNIY